MVHCILKTVLLFLFLSILMFWNFAIFEPNREEDALVKLIFSENVSEFQKAFLSTWQESKLQFSMQPFELQGIKLQSDSCINVLIGIVDRFFEFFVKVRIKQHVALLPDEHDYQPLTFYSNVSAFIDKGCLTLITWWPEIWQIRKRMFFLNHT